MRKVFHIKCHRSDYMLEYKKQHCVPQFYLRQFSHDSKMVYVYNIDHKKAFRMNIKNICQEKYFYCETPELEQILGKIEEKQDEIIKKIIEKSNVTFLEAEERFYLHLFVLMQYNRTKESKDFVDRYINTVFDEQFKPLMKESDDLIEKGVKPELIDSLKIEVERPHLMAMAPAMMGAELIIDLLPVLILNQTDNNFITSDSPICLYNYINSKNHGMLGFQSLGLQIFCPLNEKILILLVDPELYYLDLDENSIIHVKEPSDIDVINKLQIFNCLENLIFPEEEDEDYVRQLHMEIEDNFKKSKIKSILVFKKFLENGTYGEIVNTYRTKIDYTLKLSFLKLNHKKNRILKGKLKRAKKLGEPIVLCRDSEICRIVKERIDKKYREAKEKDRKK